MNLKTERNKAMQKAYAFARSGNAEWAQRWIDRASQFLAVDPQQVAYANRLLRESDRIRSVGIECPDTSSYNGLSVGDKVVLTQDKPHYKTGIVAGFALDGLYCTINFGAERAVLFAINGEYAAQFRSHYVTIKKE